MFCTANQILHNPYDAQDAVQQAFLSIIKNPGNPYLSTAATEQSLLQWFDEDANIAYTISGYLDSAVMLHIAAVTLYETFIGLVPLVSQALTFSDFIDKHREYMTSYDIQYASLDNISCKFSADISYSFTYARMSGSGDSYRLSCVESKAEALYRYSGFLRIEHENGKVDTIPDGSNLMSATFKNSNYGNLNKVITAFYTGGTTYDSLGNYSIKAAGKTFVIPIEDLPSTPSVIR